MTAYAERHLGLRLPSGLGLVAGLFAAGALGLMIVDQPVLGFAAVFGLALGVAVLTWPNVATYAVVFLIYTNAAAVAVKYHGFPYTFGIVIPALLVVPVAYFLFRRRPIVADLPMLAMFVLLFVQLVSTLHAEDKGHAWGQLQPFILEGVVIYLLVRNAVRTVDVLRGVVWALLLAGAFMALVVIYQEATATYSKPYLGFGQVGADYFVGKARNARLAGPIGDPNYFAQILLTLVPLGLLRIWAERTIGLRIAAAGVTGVIAFALTLTFSRGAAVAFLVVLILMTVLRFVRFYQLIAVVVGIVVLLSFVPAYKDRVATLGIVTGGGASSENTGADASVTNRRTEMLAAWLVFVDHPLVGVGPGSFPLYYQRYALRVGLGIHESAASARRRGEEARRESHNMFLSIAADLGIAGLLAFLGLVGITFLRLNRSRKRWLTRHPEAANLAASFLLAMAAYLTSGLFLTLAFERYFWLIVALAGSAAALDVGEEKEEKAVEPEATPAPQPVRAAVRARPQARDVPVRPRTRPARRPAPRPVPVLPPARPRAPVPVAARPLTAAVEVDLKVSPFEAAVGAVRLLEFPRSVPCPTCSGTGSVHGAHCAACEGVGRVVEPTIVRVFVPPNAQEGQRVPVADPAAVNGSAPLGYVVLRVEVPKRDRIIRYVASAGLLGSFGFLAFLLFFA